MTLSTFSSSKDQTQFFSAPTIFGLKIKTHNLKPSHKSRTTYKRPKKQFFEDYFEREVHLPTILPYEQIIALRVKILRVEE